MIKTQSYNNFTFKFTSQLRHDTSHVPDQAGLAGYSRLSSHLHLTHSSSRDRPKLLISFLTSSQQGVLKYQSNYNGEVNVYKKL